MSYSGFAGDAGNPPSFSGKFNGGGFQRQSDHHHSTSRFPPHSASSANGQWDSAPESGRFEQNRHRPATDRPMSIDNTRKGKKKKPKRSLHHSPYPTRPSPQNSPKHSRRNASPPPPANVLFPNNTENNRNYESTPQSPIDSGVQLAPVNSLLLPSLTPEDGQRQLQYLYSIVSRLQSSFSSTTAPQDLPPTGANLSSIPTEAITEQSPVNAVGDNQARDPRFADVPPVEFSPRSPMMAWSPTLVLPIAGNPTCQISLHEIVESPFTETFLLDHTYHVEHVLPRSFFSAFGQVGLYGAQHRMVFKWPEPESDFWADLAGLRKTVFVHVREKDTGRQWEMHLKPAKDRTHRKLFAYFLPMGALRTAMRAQVDKLLEEKRLPLVLDIDDTLVRAVGAENKYVKAEHVALLPPSRLANLRDGRQIVLASSMLRFLDWAREKFEISICSIGDQDYVNQIAEFLNRGVLPGAPPRITGVTYSARPEYEHLKQVHGQDKELQDKSGKGALPPPKDLRSLYGFWHVHDMEKGKPVAPSDGFGFGLEALIVDDNPLAWPKNQLPHLIEIRPKVNTEAGIWDVSFGPVQAALASIHARFFEDHAVWSENRTLPQASVLNFYNEYCRRLLTKAIAEEN